MSCWGHYACASFSLNIFLMTEFVHSINVLLVSYSYTYRMRIVLYVSKTTFCKPHEGDCIAQIMGASIHVGWEWVGVYQTVLQLNIFKRQSTSEALELVFQHGTVNNDKQKICLDLICPTPRPPLPPTPQVGLWSLTLKAVRVHLNDTDWSVCHLLRGEGFPDWPLTKVAEVVLKRVSRMK